MCSCAISRFHGYEVSNSLLDNLFKLDFGPPPGAKFWVCECPSSYLYNGLSIGIVMIPALFAVGLLWSVSRTTSLAVAATATLLWAVTFGLAVYKNVQFIEQWSAHPSVDDRIVSLATRSMFEQGIFEIVLYMIVPVALGLVLHRGLIRRDRPVLSEGTSS